MTFCCSDPNRLLKQIPFCIPNCTKLTEYQPVSDTTLDVMDLIVELLIVELLNKNYEKPLICVIIIIKIIIGDILRCGGQFHFHSLKTLNSGQL